MDNKIPSAGTFSSFSDRGFHTEGKGGDLVGPKG